jgi:hypothetical protein
MIPYNARHVHKLDCVPEQHGAWRTTHMATTSGHASAICSIHNSEGKAYLDSSGKGNAKTMMSAADGVRQAGPPPMIASSIAWVMASTISGLSLLLKGTSGDNGRVLSTTDVWYTSGMTTTT